jgi:hypothetical protein
VLLRLRFHCTQEAVDEAVGRSRESVQLRLRVNCAREAVAEGRLIERERLLAAAAEPPSALGVCTQEIWQTLHNVRISHFTGESQHPRGRELCPIFVWLALGRFFTTPRGRGGEAAFGITEGVMVMGMCVRVSLAANNSIPHAHGSRSSVLLKPGSIPPRVNGC